MAYFKAFIRVVKSLSSGNHSTYFGSYFGVENVIEERLIEATDKNHVKQQLLEKYPQFFQNGKVYEKETKDKAQFFYVVIYPLYQREIDMLNEGPWHCHQCKQVYENKYLHKPRIDMKIFPDKLFCKTIDDVCLTNFKREYYKDVDLPDDEIYVRKDSPTYIYKITEKATGKCYIGKTRNEPFFRWWNHYKHSGSPFGLYLQKTRITDWLFEVLEILPREVGDSEVFKVESTYIVKYNSIDNGFNSVISNKIVYDESTKTP